MSTGNGHQSTTQLLTIEELIRATEKDVILPYLSTELGETKTVRVRKLGRVEFLGIMPPLPPGSETWKREEADEKERAWLATLSPEALEARRAEVRLMNARLIALVSQEPKLTVEQAQHLADDAVVLASEILRFSGIVGATSESPPAQQSSEEKKLVRRRKEPV